MTPSEKEPFAPPLTPEMEGSSKCIYLVVTDPEQILSSSLLIGREANNTSFFKTQLVMTFYPDLDILQEELASNSKEMTV
jgi:hypothetical protein